MTDAERPSIVLPVYGAVDEALRCIDSVLRSTEVPYRLYVVDDGNTRAARARLKYYVGSDTVTLVSNPVNRGFAFSVNRIIASTNSDIVLLNSDVVVTPGWLARMRATAYSRPDVATVTPLTNFGSICTVPADVLPFPLETDSEIDMTAAHVLRASLRLRPEILVGVGFCLFVRRTAIRSVGMLDEGAFASGYGEEVDLCLRATADGWVHLLEDSTFVYHRGGASFGDRRDELLERSADLLAKRHSDFPARRRAYEDHNAAGTVFRNLELVRCWDGGRAHVAQLLHRSLGGGGGIERHTRRLVTELRKTFDVSIIYAHEGRLWADVYGERRDCSLSLPLMKWPVHAIDDPGYAKTLKDLLHVLQPDAIHVQHLANHSLSALEVVLNQGAKRTVVSLRDFHFLCPSFNLQYRGKLYCQVPDDFEKCDNCLGALCGWGRQELGEWRSRVNRALGRFNSVVVPHASVLEVFSRAFDVSSWHTEVAEHGRLVAYAEPRRLPRNYFSNGPLRVAFVGTSTCEKGYEEFCELAQHVAGDDIELVHLGTRHHQMIAESRIAYLGPYSSEELPNLLRRHRCHVVCLLSRWPETHSHVLSEAIAASIPVVASSLGALAERTTRLELGWVRDADDISGMAHLLRELAGERALLEQRSEHIATVRLRTIDEDAKLAVTRYGVLEMDGRKIDSHEQSRLVRALAADNANIAREVAKLRVENEKLRRQMGERPAVALADDDIEASAAYRLALHIRARWKALPYRPRKTAERFLRRWL